MSDKWTEMDVVKFFGMLVGLVGIFCFGVFAGNMIGRQVYDIKPAEVVRTVEVEKNDYQPYQIQIVRMKELPR